MIAVSISKSLLFLASQHQNQRLLQLGRAVFSGLLHTRICFSMAGPQRIPVMLLLLLAIIGYCSAASAEAALAPDSRLLRQQLQQADGASTQTTHKGPTAMSFFGPALAGVLAIVLIGAVVTFKNRVGK